MNRAPRLESSAAVAGLLAASLVLVSLIPLAPAQRYFPPLDLGLLIAAGGFVAATLMIAMLTASLGARREVPQRLETATLWGAASLASLTAIAAVAASAQSFNLEYIVLAQRHSALFVLTQPAAASIYLVAVALAGHGPAVDAVVGSEPTRARSIALVAALAALSALGATLFLGGFAGSGLPAPVWLVLKSVAVAALLLAMRRRLSGLTPSARLAVAWAGCLLGFLNLAVSLVLAPR